MKRFHFDMHNFDEEYVDPNIEEEPPPPTFSEEELEAAKLQAFQAGKQEGLEESRKSREQEIARILQEIITQIPPLFQAESTRETTYELEAVKLTYAVFKKLFPVYEKAYGFAELTGIMGDILEKNKGQANIIVAVHPDAVEDVSKHIETINHDAQFQVQKDEDLEPMSCKLRWSDGGGVRYSGRLAKSIACAMEEALGGRGVNVQELNQDIENIQEKTENDEGGLLDNSNHCDDSSALEEDKDLEGEIASENEPSQAPLEEKPLEPLQPQEQNAEDGSDDNTDKSSSEITEKNEGSSEDAIEKNIQELPEKIAEESLGQSSEQNTEEVLAEDEESAALDDEQENAENSTNINEDSDESSEEEKDDIL